VLAHPGAPFASLHRHDILMLQRQAELTVVGSSDKEHVVFDRDASARPLGAVYMLRRTERGSRLEITPIEPPDPRLLLGAALAPYLVTPERLLHQLDVCATLARTVPMFELATEHAANLQELDRVAAALHHHAADTIRRTGSEELGHGARS
jgi:hypothetical protein